MIDIITEVGIDCHGIGKNLQSCSVNLKSVQLSLNIGDNICD